MRDASVARVGERPQDMARKLQDRLLEYGPNHLRLLLQVMRELAHGRPLTAEQVDRFIADLGIAPDAAGQFLRDVTERDAQDQIVGAMGLSLQDHPHRLSVGGVALSAWCAEDTLFLPAILQQTASVESPSPVNGRPIRLRVSPERVEEVSPAGAVVSLVVVDPTREHMASVEAIWSAFCTHIHFFATRDEAEGWAAGRDDIAILSVEEGFAWQRPVWSEVLLAAAE
jgi:alkylmercury lyase